jgi:hypothetical protein
VRNVLIRKTYTPSSGIRIPSLDKYPCDSIRGADEFVRSLLAGEMTLEEVSEHYASLVYAKTGRYDLTSQKLGIDWRTVKDKVNDDLVSKFRR